MTRVLYVMGAGRSGSTILGVVLENCDGVFYAGELDAWLRTCGTPAYPTPEAEELWREVKASLAEYEDLCGERCLRTLEHSTAALHPAQRRGARSLRARYRRFNAALYAAVAAATGCDAVVDSSHYPLRLREVRAIDGVEAYAILLVRDPHAVVESFRSTSGPGGKGLWGANAYLWLTHLLSTVVFLSHPRDRRLLVRHESVLTRPEQAVRAILDVAGLRSTLPDMEALDTGRALAGNRILHSRRVALDGSAGSGDGAPRSFATTLLQLPWTIVFRLLERRDDRAPSAGDELRPEVPVTR